jgi:hypothetical protein
VTCYLAVRPAHAASHTGPRGSRARPPAPASAYSVITAGAGVTRMEPDADAPRRGRAAWLNDATGGTITHSGDYQIHTYATGGNFRDGFWPEISHDRRGRAMVGAGAGRVRKARQSEDAGDPTLPAVEAGNGGEGGPVIVSSALTASSFVASYRDYSAAVGTTTAASSSALCNGGTLPAAGRVHRRGGGGGSESVGNAGITGTTSILSGASVSVRQFRWRMAVADEAY